MRFKYLEQQIFLLPDRIDGTPKKSGVARTIDLNVRDRNQVYMIEYDGYMKVPKSGRYRLILGATRAKLFLDQDPVMHIDRRLAPQETARDMCLESGCHPIRIVTDMFLQPSHVLELYWEGPGMEKQVSPAQAFYHD